MSDNRTGRLRPMLRIAIPAWRLPAPDQPQERRLPAPEEFRDLLESGPRPLRWRPSRFTRAERHQIAMSARLRRALYGPSEAA